MVKKKISKFNRKLLVIMKFVLLLNLISLPLYIANYTIDDFGELQVAIAEICNRLLNAVGYETVTQGNVILTVADNSLLRFSISRDSTGWKSVYALVALVMASPIVLNKKIRFVLLPKQKLIFLSMTLPIIFIANIFRVATTIGISISYGFSYFGLVHDLLWSVGMIGVVLGIWLIWIRRQRYNIG